MKSHAQMLTRRAGPLLLTMGLCATLITGCGSDRTVGPQASASDATVVSAPTPQGPVPKITGSVEIVFKGGNGNDPNENDGQKRAFVDIVAFEPTAYQPGHGTFTYTVTDSSGVVHRQITIQLEGARIDPTGPKAMYCGVVVSDTKGCSGGSGGPGGGHEPGCPGGDCGDDHGHVPGGCSGTDGSCGASHDHVEGGCSGTDGGCTDTDHDHVDGGCSGTDGSCGASHDHVEGGCSGTDGHDGGHDGGCSGSSGGGGSCGGHDGDPQGGPTRVNGRSCRVGQILAGKAHDGGTPGIEDDGITWKWFDADDPSLPTLDDVTTWGHLCRKTIVAGNLTVHVGRDDPRIQQ